MDQRPVRQSGLLGLFCRAKGLLSKIRKANQVMFQAYHDDHDERPSERLNGSALLCMHVVVRNSLTR